MASGKCSDRHKELRLRYDPEKRIRRLVEDDAKPLYMSDTRKYGYAAGDSEIIYDTASRKWRYKRPEQ